MQCVQGEIKRYQVTHSISHHYVTTASAALLAIHMLTCAHALSLPPDNSRTGSPLINLQQEFTHKAQTAAAADRNWDLERVAENQKVQIQGRVLTFPSIFTSFISLQCTLNTNGRGLHSQAALMIYSYGSKYD